jgi:hypothetical protein
MSRLLTTTSTIQCAHGAAAVLITGNTRVSAGARVLREDDVHVVTGCTHVTGGDSACVKIEWKNAAKQVAVGGVAPLTTSSIGTCKNAGDAAQGVAVIVVTQQRASAR